MGGAPGPIPNGTYKTAAAADVSPGFKKSGFNGVSSSGVWTLRIADESVTNTGALNGWTLRLRSGGDVSCIQTCTADFNCDGDVGTDADIEAFFACLAGTCPPPPCRTTADFNGDGDVGTDADIESFFRVLAGGPC